MSYPGILRHSRFSALGILLAAGLLGCAGANGNSTQAAGQDLPLKVASLAAAGSSDMALAAESTAPRTEAFLPAPPVVPPAARQAVIDAYDAMQKKRWAELARLVPVAADDPVLGIYPRYWALRQKLLNRAIPVPEAEVQQFLADFPDTWLAEQARSDWILAAVRAGDHARALSIGPVEKPSAQLRCALLMARHLTGKRAQAAEVMNTWQANGDCWSMLDQVAADHVLSRKELNTMLRNELEIGKESVTKRLAAVVFDENAMVQYAALMKNPRKWLESRSQPRSQTDFELAAIALSRLARSEDRAEAAQYIRDKWAAWMPKHDLQWVWGQFGLIAALNVEPDAARWYRESGFVPMTDYNHAWEVRSELRASPLDWSRVAASIRKMSARQAAEPVWQYWYGRALAAEGNHLAANQYFELVSADLGFYGLLATEELGHKPALPPPPLPVDTMLIRQARANPGLQRAVALFDLGWRREAVPEWNHALRSLDDSQLRAAAEFAREEHIYDRVVNTSLLTRESLDFSQRFIAPFEGRVSAKAREINLDPAWVYGLIRQESRFITDARSRVGASGLMQLMPTTAKYVARKIGLKDFHLSQVNDFDTNTLLGTSYLDMVLRDLGGSELLATAGYNAGPGRPKRWRSRLQAPVEGAIFAETIPFTETRLYVKHVMSNAIWYAMMFSGESHSLKQRLGTVAPLAGTRTALP